MASIRFYIAQSIVPPWFIPVPFRYVITMSLFDIKITTPCLLMVIKNYFPIKSLFSINSI